jgi:hypothetical protein
VGASTIIDLLVLAQKFSTHVILEPWAGTGLSVMIASRHRIGGFVLRDGPFAVLGRTASSQ